MNSIIRNALLSSSIFLFAQNSFAQEKAEQPIPVKETQRVFGIGTAFGGGIALVESRGWNLSTGPQFYYPSLELAAFVPNSIVSIAMSAPIGNMIDYSIKNHGALVNADYFVNMSFGNATNKFVFGPGLGFGYASNYSVNAAAVHFPLNIGWEMLSKTKTVGLQFLTRPYVSFGYGSHQNIVGYGIVGLISINGFIVK